MRRRVTGLTVMILLAWYVPGQSATVPSNLLPNGSSVAAPSDVDSSSSIMLRDTGIGLSVGALAGISFIMLSHGGFSSSNNEFNSDVFLTGLSAGLLGGLMAGLWEIQRDKALSLSVSPPQGATVPATVNASIPL